MKLNLTPVGQASLLCCLVALSYQLPAQAQQPTSALETVTVTGNPLSATDLIAPAASMAGEELL